MDIHVQSKHLGSKVKYNFNSGDQICKKAKIGHCYQELLDLEKVAVDSDDGGAGEGVEASHRTGDTAEV